MNKPNKSPANVEKHLRGVTYPAERDTILRQVREQNAPPEVLDVLKDIPDELYEEPKDVMARTRGET